MGVPDPTKIGVLLVQGEVFPDPKKNLLMGVFPPPKKHFWEARGGGHRSPKNIFGVWAGERFRIPTKSVFWGVLGVQDPPKLVF